MKLGKVIGNVVASVKDPGLEGLRLLIVQGLDDNFKSIGDPYVAADGIQTAGPGDIVYVVSKKEAAIAISRDLVPIDECIVGFVEEYTVIKEAKKKSVEAKRKAKVQPPPKKVSRSRPPSKKSSLIREKSVPISSTRISSTRISSTRISSTRISSTRISSTRISSTRISSTKKVNKIKGLREII
ncbi:MAG: EutN/CcmL family microcompartment protein [Candidatus Hodarchaeales archaeon]